MLLIYVRVWQSKYSVSGDFDSGGRPDPNQRPTDHCPIKGRFKPARGGFAYLLMTSKMMVAHEMAFGR